METETAARPAAAESPPSGRTGSGATERPRDLHCPYCDFEAKAEAGLSAHVRMKHKGQPAVRFEDRPVREATPAAESSAVEPPAPPPVDLSQVGRDLASNIQALGQLLHGVLFTLKLRHLETGLPPAVDTHLGFTIQLRAQMTADLLMGYAQENPAVLRVVQGFNGLFTGGQLATVVGAHLVAAAATANLETPISQGAETVLIPDVLAHVEEENRQIERRLRLAAAAAGSANGQPA